MQGQFKLHTFGVGHGASVELIKDAASAGGGHFSFIYNVDEIENKVIEALSKDFVEYLNLKSFDLMSKD